MFSKKFLDFIKKKYSDILHPITNLLIKLKINHNLLTILGLLFGLISSYYLFINHFLFSLFIISSTICDIFDGQIARYTKKVSLFGELLDTLSDRVVQLFLLIKFALIHPLIYFVILIYVLHFILYLIFIKKRIIYHSKTLMVFLFILRLYWIGALITTIISLYGIIIQIKNSRN